MSEIRDSFLVFSRSCTRLIAPEQCLNYLLEFDLLVLPYMPITIVLVCYGPYHLKYRRKRAIVQEFEHLLQCTKF